MKVFWLCVWVWLYLLVFKESQFLFVDWAFDEEEEGGELYGGEYFSYIFEDGIIALSVPFNFLFLFEYEFGASQYFPAFIGDCFPSFLQKLFMFVYNLLPHSFDFVPPSFLLCILSMKEVCLFGGCPEYVPVCVVCIPVYIG